MTARTLNIVSVHRVRRDDEIESIEFNPGVNVILGANNAGKTMWMTLIDFLFGDNAAPAAALDELAQHYTAAWMEIGTGNTLHRVERHWGDDPSRGRMSVDDHQVSPEQFSEFILEALAIPELRFPRGSPIGPRAWPSLSWRTLLRQIYRREDSWHDIAYRQPESEQFAVLAQFVGIAPSVFSTEFASLADQVKRRADLLARKAHFEAMLDEIGRDIVSVADAPGAVTAEAIERAITAVQRETEERVGSREALLRETTAALPFQEPESGEEANSLGTQLGQLRKRRSDLAEEMLRSTARLQELDQHHQELEADRNKLRRAQIAGDTIGPLHVTHCPVCDQSVEARLHRAGGCYLCLQPVTEGVATESADRMQFEITQLSEELREIRGLRARAEAEGRETGRLVRDVVDEIGRTEMDLRQLTSAVAWVLPPDLSELDRTIGGLGERLRQLERLRGTLELRDQITAGIDRLSGEIGHLEGEVRTRQAEPPFERIGDLLAEAMTDYLNALDVAGQQRWGQRRITVDVSANAVLLLVNGKRWTMALGANLRAYFLMALQYALIKLSRTEPFVYPGFALLDFPANLGQHTGLSDDENYLLKPFIDLLARPELTGTQVIAAGRAFQQLDGATLIPLGSSY